LIIFSGTADTQSLGKLANFTQHLPMAKVEGTSKTVGDYLAQGARLIPVPAKDGKGVLVSVPLDNDKLATPLSNNKPALPEVVKAIRVDAATVTGFESHVTGIGGILADLFGSFGSLDSSLLLTTFIVVAIILICVYRSPVLWFIPLFCAVMALSIGGCIVYLLAKNGTIALDGQSQGILSVLVIGAATDYALLLIARYREELHHFDSRVDAMRVAVKGVFEPIVASGLTVIAGLLVLGLSELKSVRSLGPVAAIGILSAQIVMLTLLPAILVLCGRWIFWPKVPRHDDVDDRLSGIWSKVSDTVGRRPRRVWIGSGLLLVISAGFAFQLNTTGLSQTEAFTGKPDSVIGLTKLSEHFPAGSGDPTLVFASVADRSKVMGVLESFAGVDTATATMNVTTGMADGPGMGDYGVKIVDGWTQIQVILDKPADSVAAQNYIPAMRDKVHAVSPTALIGGSTATNYDIGLANRQDRNLIIPVALLVIGIILALLLRSLVAPVLLIATTVLSFGATLGICHLVFTHIFKFPGTDGAFPLYAFIFLVALGIDYNIFLMTRIREEAQRIGTREGILKGVTVTGGVITSAGIVLAATFAVLATLPLVFLVELGFAVAFGVLLDTIVVRSLLVPAMSYEMNNKVWWPSALSKSETPQSVETEMAQ
jgi:RND superfamily putative drug exporter